MPNFDRTGPQGQGEMTGRGMGNCDGANRNGMNRRCFGGGRGIGKRFFGSTQGTLQNSNQTINLTIEEETLILENRLKELKKDKSE
jgi:hypothetical protein